MQSIVLLTTDSASTLKLVQIVHRHGDRTPISFYKTDPHKSLDNWEDGLGELTPKGKKRMYEFGLKLRIRYNTILGNTPKNIYVRSSGSNRCIESAAALVTGLYKPQDRWIWSTDSLASLWQPIAIQTVLKSSDGLLVSNSDCPAADEAYEEVMRSKEVQKFMESHKDFIKKVGEKTGENITKLRQLDYLYDTLHAEIDFDNTFTPKWLNELGNDTLETLKQFEWNAFKFDWSSKIIQRLRAGLILQELTQNMKNATNPSIEPSMKKVYSYATHDTLLVTILQALGIYSGTPPSYGSALLFELHQNSNNESFVHLFYANVTPEVTIKELNLTICGLNETNCELNKFINSVKEFIPDDWQKECNLVDDKSCKSKAMLHDVAHAAIGFGIGVVTVITLLLIALLIKKIRQRKHYFANSNSVNNQFIQNLK